MTGRILSRVLVVVGLVAGQGPGLVPEATAQEDSGATFRAGVEAVSVSAAVRDSRGRVVQTLKKEDFEVLDRGFVTPVKDFYAGQSAISVALVLDISGSMGVGGNMDRAREAVRLMLSQLNKPGDEAAFYTFEDRKSTRLNSSH